VQSLEDARRKLLLDLNVEKENNKVLSKRLNSLLEECSQLRVQVSSLQSQLQAVKETMQSEIQASAWSHRGSEVALKLKEEQEKVSNLERTVKEKERSCAELRQLLSAKELEVNNLRQSEVQDWATTSPAEEDVQQEVDPLLVA